MEFFAGEADEGALRYFACNAFDVVLDGGASVSHFGQAGRRRKQPSI
ncbi:hypothetical protein [Amycolatopsis orientalis]|nr:hypothetical protein [Amycolatopsis orientalis]